MSSFSCTGSVLYNAPERRENKKVKNNREIQYRNIQ